jgi:ABC-2 type transport system permease protein
VTTPEPTLAPAAAIHDLGYRRYDGPRGGARAARRALFAQGLRALFGIGRPARAKAIPVFVLVVTLLPALGILAAASASRGQIPVRYANFIGAQLILFALFGAAQAPELLCGDRQHRLLPLLLTRAMSQAEYALVRWLAIWTALLLVALAPLLLLYVGEIGIAKDPAATFRAMGTRIGPVLAHATLAAWVLAGLATLASTLTPRRAYATALTIGVLLVLAAVAAGLGDLSGIPEAVPELLDPMRALRTLAARLFDEPTRGMEVSPPPPIPVFVGTLLAIGTICLGVAWTRLRRVIP